MRGLFYTILAVLCVINIQIKFVREINLLAFTIEISSHCQHIFLGQFLLQCIIIQNNFETKSLFKYLI